VLCCSVLNCYVQYLLFCKQNTCKSLQDYLKTQKNEENTTCILPNQLYKFSHRIPLYEMSVTKGNAPLRCCFVFDRAPLSIENLSVGIAIGLSSKECIGMHFFLSLLILYNGIQCENLYS